MRLGLSLRVNSRGGILLDAVLVLGIVMVGAFLLYGVGLTFHTILRGAEHFFGL